MKKLQLLATVLLSCFALTAHAATELSTQDYDLYPGDFNGDGKTDLLYVAKDSTKQSGIAVSDGNGPNIQLQSWALDYLGIPWGGNIYRPIVADFNGDGRADIFMQRRTPGNHYLLLSDGVGKITGISQGLAFDAFGADYWPSADQHTIVAGDFNGDGKADLLLQGVTSSVKNAIVFANANGGFNVNSSPNLNWGNDYLGLKWSAANAFIYVGDFNADGNKDLLLQARPRFVGVSSKNSNGSSSANIPTPVPNYPPNANAVLISQGGATPFQLSNVRAFSRNDFGADFSPLTSTVVVGDFNGDGRTDIVLQARYTDRPSYLVTTNASGNLFSTATALANNVALSSDSYRLIAGNFDGTGGAGLYLQTVTPLGGNAYANTITGSSIAVTGHSAPTSVGIVSSNTVGVTPGSFAIGNDGTANYSIPIVVPPGVAGVQPQLALTYSSSRGNGWLGVGWDISGLSQITRCPKTFAQDGVAEAVTLSMSDRFCLDGARLRKTSANGYGEPNSTYRTEVETFTSVTAYGTAGNGPAYFYAKTKNGLTYVYGYTADSRIESSGSTTPRTWALNSVFDPAGNSMVVSYMESTGSFHPTEILYTSNYSANISAAYKVKFIWDPRPATDVLSGYFAGGVIKEAFLLNRIETQINDSPPTGAFRVVRKYQLSYNSGNTGRSRLGAVQECDGGGNCLSPTSISWQEGQSGVAAPVLAATGIWVPLDINGDGRADIATIGSVSGTAKILYRLANASGGFDPQQEQAPFSLSSSAPIGVKPFDYNGDGRSDLLVVGAVVSGGSAQYLVAQSTGSAFTFIPTGIPYTYVPIQNLIQVADVNGDGRPDFISAFPLAPLKVRFNGPSGFGAEVEAFPATQQNSVGAIYGAGDFNADGRADLLINRANSNAAPDGIRILLSQGTTFVDAGLPLSNDAAPTAGDINGDGIDDIAYKCGSNRCLRFGGAGGPLVGLGTEVDTGQPGAASGVFVADWDGDGKADVIQGTNGSNFQWLRSTGETLVAPADTGVPTAIGAFADANGDGLADFFYSPYNTNHYDTNLSLRQPGIADRVTSIADGFGNATTVTYASLTDSSVYTKGSGATFPQADVQQPMQVVKQYGQTDGTGGSYTVSATYGAARIDRTGRGFLGFASRRLRDSRNNIYVKDYYRQDFPFIGAVYQRDVLQPDNATLISRVTNSYTSLPLDTSANNQRYLVTTSGSVAKSYEVGGTKNSLQISEQTTNILYDGFANPIDITVSTTDKDSGSPFYNQIWQTRTVNVFDSDMGNYWCTLLKQSTVTSTLPDGTAQSRTVSFANSMQYCRATQQIVEPSVAPLRVKRDFGYDNCGNVNSIGVTGRKPDGTDMATRTTAISYGSRCVFPETVTNPLGHMTKATYRFDLGAPESTTDINGFVANFSYDGFGRLLRANRPDGTATDQYYLSCTVPNNYFNFCGVSDLRFQVQTVERATGNVPISTAITFFDSLGRARISQSQRATGAASYVSASYDSLGRPVTTSRPYSTSSNGFSRNTYDLLNRLTKVELVRPDASVDRTSTIAYAGGTVTSTDPKLNTKTQVFDAAGLLRRVTDASGSTQYAYDPFRNLRTVVDPLMNTTTIGYNIRGFKTSIADPDRGSSSSIFNSLGELLSQTDAKNQTVSVVYDALSRPLTRNEPEGMTTWTWDSAAYGKGALASVSSPGYSETYLYDNRGRAQQVTYNQDSTNYQVNYDYNNQGFLDSVTYPESTSAGTGLYRLKLKYAYAYGSLVQVKDFNAPSNIFWTLNATDDANHPIDETLGGDPTSGGVVRQTSIYNALTGELNNRQAGSGGSTTNLQNLAYQWDKTGNLQQRQDSLQSKTEVFAYDSLDRLTGSTLNGTTNLSVAFNVLGNITSKSDVGTYNYTTAQSGCSYYAYSQPHAVRSAGGNSYCYDANGNMTKRAGSTISYTSFDLPSQINQGTDSSQFSYGANRQRWKQVATYGGTTETTIYIAGLLDKVTRGGVTEYRHYIATGSDARAIYTRRSDGTTETYYVSSDHLGSTSVITDHTGALKTKESFTAFGARRGSNWSGAPSDLSQIAAITRDGFTGHEHLDNLNLIHMNGRVYDPTLGRFLSADPIVQDPTNSQSFNRYSYVFNSPLSYTDPSGFEPKGPDSPGDVTLENIDLDNLDSRNYFLVHENFDSFIPNVSDSFNKLIGSPYAYALALSAFGLSPQISFGPPSFNTLNAVPNNAKFVTGQGHNANDSVGLSASFVNEFKIPFTNDAPAGLTALRQANPQLVALENELFEKSLPSEGREARERALLVYQNVNDGTLKFDTSYIATKRNPKTGNFDGVGFELDPVTKIRNEIPVPQGYRLLVVEHTHPFPTIALLFGAYARGPSELDRDTSQKYPGAFFVIQGLKPYLFETEREFLYYGPAADPAAYR